MNKEQFRTIRIKAGLTQSQLADLLRLKSNQSISRMENGTRNISGPVSLVMELLRDHSVLFKR